MLRQYQRFCFCSFCSIFSLVTSLNQICIYDPYYHRIPTMPLQFNDISTKQTVNEMNRSRTPHIPGLASLAFNLLLFCVYNFKNRSVLIWLSTHSPMMSNISRQRNFSPFFVSFDFIDLTNRLCFCKGHTSVI